MASRRAPVIDHLEGRTLFTAAPLLIDFGTNGGTAAQFAGVNTPAHEDGVLAAVTNWYSLVGDANVGAGGLRIGTTGGVAAGVSLTWGRSTSAGGAINWTELSGDAFLSYGDRPLVTLHITELTGESTQSQITLSDFDASTQWVSPGLAELDSQVAYGQPLTVSTPEPATVLLAIPIYMICRRRTRR